MTDPSQPQLRQQNEQALSMKVTNLGSQNTRAIYKKTNYDMRRYKRLQLFVHAEKFRWKSSLALMALLRKPMSGVFSDS